MARSAYRCAVSEEVKRYNGREREREGEGGREETKRILRRI
jgi:hypothetical protein